MAKGKENKMEKKDNLPNYTDYDEFSPDNFEFETDNFDLNFEDEEATNEEELKRIQDMKATKQKEQEVNTEEQANQVTNDDDANEEFINNEFVNNEDELIKDKDKSTSINDDEENNEDENEELKLQEHPFDNENLISEEEQQLAESLENDDLLKNERTSDIIKMDLEIDNMDLFIKHMESKDYQLESSRFLTKKFAEASDTDTIYSIVITVNNETITAITGYDMDDKVVTIPDAIKKVVKTDINDALRSFI